MLKTDTKRTLNERLTLIKDVNFNIEAQTFNDEKYEENLSVYLQCYETDKKK